MLRKTKFITFIVLLLGLSLAVADVTLTVDDTYSNLDPITVTGQCAAPFVPVAFQVSGGDEPWFDLVHSSHDGNYSFTYTPLKEATYTAYVACDGEAKNQEFCVGSQCVQAAPPAAPPSGGGGSSGGGGGYFKSACPNAEWSYTSWSVCNSSLRKSRVGTDLSGCEKEPKLEVESCSACEEAWTCLAWSECVGGTQTRTCFDETKCGTTFSKPAESQSCTPGVAGSSAPDFGSGDFGTPGFGDTSAPEVQQPAAESFSFVKMWNEFKAWIIGGVAGLVLLIVIVLVVLHFVKGKHVVFNVDELKAWITKEHNMGTSYADIKEMLVDHTGWKHDEIVEAFKELGVEEPVDGQGPAPAGAVPPQQPPVRPPQQPGQPGQPPAQ